MWLGPAPDVDVETTEIGIALGPTYTLNDRVAIYGGPFFYLLDGEVDGTMIGAPMTHEFEQDAKFGGYIGTQIQINENLSFRIEYEHTSSADAAAAALVWTFK